MQPIDNARARNESLVRRIHRLRTLGLALGFLCVASVLELHDAPPIAWLLLAVNAFAWPHFALLLALRSGDARRAEVRNLTVDSALGGVWIAVMQFSLLPSVLVVTMLSADKISVGGARLLIRTLALLVGACATTSALLGFPVDVATPMSVIVACAPILMIYPVALSAVAYRLASKVTQQNRRLEELGRTDILTGLANRRQCFAEAQVELERHFRTGRPVSLIILDVDHFKDINDDYGHPAGDEVLRGLAVALRACCRAIDTPARYGGDEFMVILPETDLRGAEEVAGRIRDHMKSVTIERAPDLHCTVSLGAAEVRRNIKDVGTWIQRADAALYRAKAGGRDRFEGVAE
jgi:diguanylate cyclase